MPRKPVARNAVLDAFETLLIEVGERGATLEAVAAKAGVSKGGLLYHFPNKEALIAALLDRFDELAQEEVEAMKTAPEGAGVYFIKASVWDGGPLDRSFVAASRLAEVAHEETQRRFAGIQQQWLEVLTAELGEDLARAVRYMSDGLYFNAVLENGGGREMDPSKTDAEVESLLRILELVRGKG
ncbi:MULTISPECIES: TetR/AcrR family transcriptional regulator [Arthrobacter]|uniref:TetR/AcrR family transcriptional regulator n=2 Tax=Arthrobacter TaxID=1663 RepID=A0ABU9KQJ0_9MICC|nr:TetR/AcrR family transcriptional regulator [Arthrobacter sp. YJM1]MDP5227773.1 TetR/AcrR family transcriptional regulator [Arthrobacter sp. YJM1]